MTQNLIIYPCKIKLKEKKDQVEVLSRHTSHEATIYQSTTNSSKKKRKLKTDKIESQRIFTLWVNNPWRNYIRRFIVVNFTVIQTLEGN